MPNRGKQIQATSPYRGTGIWWPYVVGLVGLAAIVALVVQNGHEVDFEWLWIDFETSLAVMILATALVSMAATSLVGLVWRRHRRHVLGRTEPEGDVSSAGRGSASEPIRLPRASS